MNEELEFDSYSRPLYETASIYEMEDVTLEPDASDCENLYALPC